MVLRFPEDTQGLVNKVVFQLHETFSEPVVEVDLFSEVTVEPISSSDINLKSSLDSSSSAGRKSWESVQADRLQEIHVQSCR